MDWMEGSDAAIVQQVRSGEPDAFGVLVERHSRSLFRLAYRMTGNESDAEDVVQEAFLRAYRQLARFEARSSFGTWIYRIGVNCALDLMRSRQRHPEHPLEQMAEPSQPARVRGKAAFWMGVARGRRGYETLKQMLNNDPSEDVQEKVAFALSQSKEPEALDTLIGAARSHRSTDVRGKALFWLGQKAGKKAAAAITEAVEEDPELEIKKRAVFALSQLPPEEGVPLLIRVARTHQQPEVRKKAMFWLGQSKDARALAFFEEVLKR